MQQRSNHTARAHLRTSNTEQHATACMQQRRHKQHSPKACTVQRRDEEKGTSPARGRQGCLTPGPGGAAVVAKVDRRIQQGNPRDDGGRRGGSTAKLTAREGRRRERYTQRWDGIGGDRFLAREGKKTLAAVVLTEDDKGGATAQMHKAVHNHITPVQTHESIAKQGLHVLLGILIYIVDSRSQLRSERMHHRPHQEQVHANNKALVNTHIARK